MYTTHRHLYTWNRILVLKIISSLALNDRVSKMEYTHCFTIIFGQVSTFWYYVTREMIQYSNILRISHDMRKIVHTMFNLYTQIVSSVLIILWKRMQLCKNDLRHWRRKLTVQTKSNLEIDEFPAYFTFSITRCNFRNSFQIIERDYCDVTSIAFVVRK